MSGSETKTFNIDFRPNPMQHGFITSKARADLFSSRRGEGKSTALCWSIFYHTRHNPGANWAVVRDTFENLQKTTMETFFNWFPPGIAGHYHHTRKQFTWANGVAEGTVSFLGMDDPQDATRFLSWELAGICMDEPAPAVGSAGIDETIFDLGMTCLRQPGMSWYSMKLAENNPDESHWTYRRFVQPGDPEYVLWQPHSPENIHNLPKDYYENMRRDLSYRPDLIRRFVDGEFGFQQEGQAVTPQWSDKIHLATGLVPMERQTVYCLYDFGLTPVCIITQVAPTGHWLILDACIGEDMGIEELIDGKVRGVLADRYHGCALKHIGDPSGNNREQTSSSRSAVRIIKRKLGGTWRNGPVKWEERRDPLQSVLSRTIGGTGLVQVDRERAAEVWYALRGGWHYHVARTGVVSPQPKKTHPESDVGDAMSYGAALLFPPARKRDGRVETQEDNAHVSQSRWRALGGPAPTHGTKLGGCSQPPTGYFGRK